MPHRALRRIRRPLLAGALAAMFAVGAAACGGGDKVKLSEAVDTANEQLKPFNAKINCPDTVDKDTNGFDCTVQGISTGKTATFRAILVGENKDTVAAADESALQTAVGEVTR